ncbi:MAG: TRAP transporter large permease [Pseudomonadota bacterium]
MEGVFLLASLFLLFLIGAPVAIALGLSSILTLILFSNESLLSLAQHFFRTVEVYSLMAIPFFILAGNLMTSGGMAQRLVDFAIALTGPIRGGLAMASVLACTLFAALSGSSPATVVAVGSICIAGMVKAGYSKPFATGIITNAGTLGIMIPPSIVMVIYGAITDSSVGALFMAGVVPGIALALAMMGTIYVLARKRQMAVQAMRADGLIKPGIRAVWGLLLIVIILGGIYAGIFTPTEAAAAAAVYAFIVALFINRDLKLAAVPAVLIGSARLTAMLMFIVANAYLFAFVLTTEQIPQTVTQALLSFDLPVWAFLLLMNVVLLLAGNFMNASAVVLIMAPIIFPIAMELGIDPIHLGVIMVINMEIGMVTPPVGLNLFVASGITNMPLMDVIRASAPWLTLLLAMLLVITYVPAISLALPRLLGML